MKATPIINSFVSGELSPKLAGRTDILQYYQSAAELRNVMVEFYGGAKKAPGTYFVAEVKDSSKDTRVIPFVFSDTQAYIIEVGDEYMRFYMNDGQVLAGASAYELATPYLEADIFELQFAQTADILYITHPDYPQAKVTRTAHNSWSIGVIDYSVGEARPALMDENVTTTTITPSAATGDGITLTANANIFDEDHVDSIWKVNTGYVKITSVATGGLKSSAIGNVLYSGTIGGTTAYTAWSEAAWSAYRGYPRCVTLHEQRLYYAYTASQPQTIWGSQILAYETFELGTDDTDGLAFSIATNQVEVIRQIFPVGEIVIGTPSGVHSLGSGSSVTPITPSNVVVKKRTTYGSSLIAPAAIGNNVFYWQDYNRILREYAYVLDSDSFEAKDATAISDHISESGIVDMAYQQSPFNILWCVRTDGKLAALTRQIEQKVSAWTLHDTDGLYKSVAVIPKSSYDEVWFVVERTIEGNTVKYIEYMTAPDFDEQEDAFFVHSGLTYDDPKTITNITQADPAVVTVAHDFDNGDIVQIRGLVERESGAIPQKTLDTMEYASDTLAQAAYVSNGLTYTYAAAITQTTYDIALSTVGDAVDSELQMAQSFQLSAQKLIGRVRLRVHNVSGSLSGSMTCRIETDDSNKPSGTLAHANATKTFDSPGAGNTVDITFDTPFLLSSSTKYWIRVYCGAQSTDVYVNFSGNSTSVYADGNAAIQADAGAWTNIAGDLYFILYEAIPYLQSYSESTIKNQGSYALKGVALITTSLNKTLTRTIAVPIILTGVNTIKLDIRASRTGSNIKIGFHDSGGETTEHTPNILVADTWQTETIDISAVATADKDDIDSIIITILNADAENTFYLDNIYTVAVASETVGMTELNNNKYIVSSSTATGFSLKTLAGVDVDSSAFTAYDTGGEVRKCVNEVSGLDHLAGKNVQVFTDGAYHEDRTVTTAGVVTLDGYYAQITIGLGYTARIKTNDLEGSPGNVNSQGKIKRVTAVNVNLYRSLDYSIGTDEERMDDVSVRSPFLNEGEITPVFTGIKRVPFPSGYDTKKQVVIEQAKCLPFQVLSILLEIEVN